MKKSTMKRGSPVVSKFTGAKGKVLSMQPFAVMYQFKRKTYAKVSNPKFWRKGRK